MATSTVKIDTTEAMAKLKDLQAEADKSKTAMEGLKEAANETKEALRSFVKACANIGFDDEMLSKGFMTKEEVIAENNIKHGTDL